MGRTPTTVLRGGKQLFQAVASLHFHSLSSTFDGTVAAAAPGAAAAMLFELRCSMMVDSNLTSTSRVNISSKPSQKWNRNTQDYIYFLARLRCIFSVSLLSNTLLCFFGKLDVKPAIFIPLFQSGTMQYAMIIPCSKEHFLLNFPLFFRRRETFYPFFLALPKSFF